MVLNQPNNIEAEKAIIGIMLQYPEKVPFIMDRMRQEMLYKTDHRKIYESMAELCLENIPIDTIAVKAKLKNINHENIDLYFCECMDSVPSGENYGHYIELITECYKKREIILHGMGMIKSAEDGIPSNEIIDKFSKNIIRVQTNKKEVNLLEKVHELNDMIDNKQSNDYLVGIPAGIDELDGMTCGWQDKDLIIIAARPSIGKTSLAVNCMRTALKAGKHVGFFSLEMSDIQITARILAQESNVNLRSLITSTIRFNQTEFIKYSKAQSVVSEYMPRLHFDEYCRSVNEIRTKAMMWKMKNNLDIIVVDFLQVMNIPNKGSVSDGLEYITAEMKSIAKDLGVPFLLLSQLSRASEKEKREPELIDLRSSGGIEQSADQIIFIHKKNLNDPFNVETWLLLKKNRNGETGRIRVEFKRESAMFKEFEEGDIE